MTTLVVTTTRRRLCPTPLAIWTGLYWGCRGNKLLIKFFIIFISCSTDMVARPKTIKKVHISFAKTAKRVDVKKLKDNLWKQLTTVSAPAPVAPEKPSQASDEVTGTLQFSEVIQTLPQLYTIAIYIFYK